MDLFEIFILIIFLVIMGFAFKCEFYSDSYYFGEKFSNQQANLSTIDNTSANTSPNTKTNHLVYPYGPQKYFNNWGWYPYRGLWPYYNPWWYFTYPYPLPIGYNNYPSNIIKRNEI